MTIVDTQRDLVRKRAMDKQLRKGVYPSASLIEEIVNEAFENKSDGLPRFTFREMKKGEASSSHDYNSLFEEIKEDFDISFEEVRRLNNRIMSLSNYYESNRIKISKLLQELELKSQGLDMKVSSSSNREIVGDTINHFLHVDFKGDTHRNIPSTNAFINLLQSDVEMKRMKNGTYKHDLSEAKVSFTTDEDHQKIHLAPFRAALEDHLYESWRTIVITNDPVSVTAELTIELPETKMASNISIDMQSGKPVYATLLVSSDGEEFVEMERRKVVSSYQWIFDSRPIKTLRFRMEKKEEDRPNGGEYEYIFGARHIEMTDNRFEKNSYFVSQPFHLTDHEAVKQITLECEDYVPSDTSVRYYVGFDYETNVIEWQEIQKDQSIVTDMVKAYNMEINHYTDGYGDVMFERFGRTFCRIAQLPHHPLKGSIKLNIGRNMWLKETIPAPFTYEATDDDSDVVVYQTGIHDWVRSISPRKNYMRIQNGFDYLQANRFHRYSTYFYIEEPTSLDATVRGTKETSHAVFLNGGQIKGVNNNYNMTLHEGWNKIEVYAYARTVNEEIILDFYQPDMTNSIFANRNELQEVSLYDLLNNTSGRVHNRFAVDEKRNLIVNYDPRRLDVQSSFKQTGGGFDKKGVGMVDGIEYALGYEFSVSKKDKHAVRFMAILTKERERVEVSPRIRSYKLIVE